MRGPGREQGSLQEARAEVGGEGAQSRSDGIGDLHLDRLTQGHTPGSGPSRLGAPDSHLKSSLFLIPRSRAPGGGRGL